MKLKSLKRKGVMIFLLLVCCATTAVFADGTIQVLPPNSVKDKGNTDLSQNSIIQFINANTPPNDIGPDHLSSGQVFATGTIGGGDPVPTGTNGTFNYFTGYDGSGYVRIWNLKDISKSVKGAYYVTSINLSLPAPPTPAPTYNIVGLKTIYKAVQPPMPKSTSGGYSLTYDGKTQKYLPAFSISVVDQSDPLEPGILFETVGRNIRIRKKGDAWDPARTFAADSQSIAEKDPVNPYYIADGKTKYEVQSRAWNYFGGTTEADYGPIYEFIIPASGGVTPAGPITFNYALKASQGSKLIVNSISIPPNLKDAAGTVIANPKASDLIKLVNAKATKNIVVILGKWDKTTGQGVGLRPDGTGSDFQLQPGEGYQLYVNSDANITLEGSQ